MFVCMYVCVCMYVYVCMYVCICVCVCICICICICICVCMCICICLYMYVYVCICMYMLYAYTYIYIYVYIYICICYMHTNSMAPFPRCAVLSSKRHLNVLHPRCYLGRGSWLLLAMCKMGLPITVPCSHPMPVCWQPSKLCSAFWAPGGSRLHPGG